MAHTFAYLSAIFLSPIDSNSQSSIYTLDKAKWDIGLWYYRKGEITGYVLIYLLLLVSTSGHSYYTTLCNS